jgi:hypothetical protein
MTSFKIVGVPETGGVMETVIEGDSWVIADLVDDEIWYISRYCHSNILLKMSWTRDKRKLSETK